MPELPEVETIRWQLADQIVGQIIKSVEVVADKAFIGNSQSVVGKKVTGVDRRAKLLLIKLGDKLALNIHLKMTGQLVYLPNETKINLKEKQKGPYAITHLPNRYTRVILTLSQGRLFFNDLRRFGWVKVLKNYRQQWQQADDRLGPEALSSQFNTDYLVNVVSKTKRAIKLVLLDQEKIAGIGNIYANEVLFMAGVMPTRPANSLSRKEIEKLVQATKKILSQAVKHRGTSDKDDAYRQLDGNKGTFQNYLKIYGKQSTRCPNCQEQIKKIQLGGRGTYFCQRCQR